MTATSPGFARIVFLQVEIVLEEILGSVEEYGFPVLEDNLGHPVRVLAYEHAADRAFVLFGGFPRADIRSPREGRGQQKEKDREAGNDVNPGMLFRAHDCLQARQQEVGGTAKPHTGPWLGSDKGQEVKFALRFSRRSPF